MDIKKIEQLMASPNIAKNMKDDELEKIGAKVVEEYDIDLMSRKHLDEINKKAMDLAKQVYEEKSFPWPGAANIKYPLVTVATIQFASRAMPEIIPDEKIVNAKIVGEDPDKAKEEKAERIGQYMDWQLTEDIDGWLDGMDRLLHHVPITGNAYKKKYFDSMEKKAASEFLTYDDIVVNARAKNLKSARRVTHKMWRYKNEIMERQAAGIWSDIGHIGVAPTPMPVDTDTHTGESGYDTDDDAPHLVLEQHRWLDLDGDGYQEPYIVTVHHETRKVFRIVARYDVDSIVLLRGKLIKINPIQYFVKYPFIPNPDGGFYDIGFGTLLYPINESINTTINQLLDSGTLANTGGGFLARGVRLRAGEVRFKPGEWKQTDVMGQDLRAGVMPLPVKDPSQVLFQLLGLLINAGRDISSVQEAMSGQKPGENVSAATVTALIEQGLKVFSGIHKRIYRSFTEELKLLFRLNYKYLNKQEYVAVLDMNTGKDDFDPKVFDVYPHAEPEFALDTQRVNRAEAMLKISGRPGLDEDGITADYLRAIKAPAQRLLPPEERPEPPPNPEMLKLELEERRVALEEDIHNLTKMELYAKVEKLRADAIKAIAAAEAEEAGIQLDQYRTFVDELGAALEEMRQVNEQRNQQGNVRPMEGGPRNPAALPATPGDSGGVGRQTG